MQEKKKIYFSRKYRHLRVNSLKAVLFMLLFVLPLVFVLLYFLEDLSNLVCNLGIRILDQYFPGVPFTIVSTNFALFSNVRYIDLPMVYPSDRAVVVNLLVCLAIVIMCSIKKWKSKPMAIYLFINGSICLVNSIYFFFAKNEFPMKAVTYSDLYMKQQAGLWVAFILLAGFSTVFVGNTKFFLKGMTVISVLLYSFLFGTARYILFLYIIEKYSILYVAVMYFVVGPVIDFMYFVIIYAFFINKMVKTLDFSQERSSWEWA